MPDDQDYLLGCLLHPIPDDEDRYYICKPNDGNQGSGIHIVKGFHGVTEFYKTRVNSSSPFDGTYVVQPYLTNPALYNGVKFDLRVYVVMMGDGCGLGSSPNGLRPCRAFLLRSGFARLCSVPYENVNESNCDVATMHIANDGVNFRNGVKMSQILRTTEHLFAYLVSTNEHRLTAEDLWTRLADLAGRVITAFQHRLRNLAKQQEIPFAEDQQHDQCYQLLGLDVMIDSEFNMWLLECNAKPCMDWEKEEVDHTVGPEVNTEVMAIAVALGLRSADSSLRTVEHNEMFQQRTIPLHINE